MDAIELAPLLVGAGLLASNLSWISQESINASAFLEAIRKLLVSGNIARAIKLCYATSATLAKATKEVLLQGNKLSSSEREVSQGFISLHFEEHEKRASARVSLWRLDLLGWALTFLVGILAVGTPPLGFLAFFGVQMLLALWIELKARQMVSDLRSCRSFFLRELSSLEGAPVP